MVNSPRKETYLENKSSVICLVFPAADIQAKSTQLHNVHKALKAVKSKQATLTEEAEINKLSVERLLVENDQLKQQLAQYQVR